MPSHIRIGWVEIVNFFVGAAYPSTGSGQVMQPLYFLDNKCYNE